MQLLNPKSDFESLRLSEYVETPEPEARSLPFALRVIDLVIVLAFAIFMCLYNIGSGSFGGGDQTTHSLVVQHMHQVGDYLHPWYDGRPYYNKPPFKMWLATIPVALLGESTFSYRVIDGICGVGIALTVFFFAQALFASRLIAYVSVFALLGSRVFFFGHGIRNAVQDGMMLFLMTLGTIVGWNFLERLRKSENPVLWPLVLQGGVLIGLSVLTKNVAGFMAYIILGSYLLLSGETISVVKRSWKQLLAIAAISFAIPIAYILVQGKHRLLAFQMLVITEVFKRATQGYHFVNHRWYYWNAIVHERITIPPEILLLGLIVGLVAIFREKDRRILFVLCWAFVPVLVQNSMKSKLVWYILPALPGMALLAGTIIGGAFDRALPALERWYSLGLRPRAAVLGSSALALVLCLPLAKNVYTLGSEIGGIQRRNAADEIVSSIQAFARLSHRAPRIVLYQAPTLANHERLYFYMEPLQTREVDSLEELKAMFTRGEVDYILTRLDTLPELFALHPVEAYSFIPARNKRRRWLAALSYERDFIPATFTPATQSFSFADDPPTLSYGFKYSRQIGSTRFRPSVGASSAILFEATIPQTMQGTQLRLSLASVLPTKDGKADIDVFMNDERVGSISQIEEGFHSREIGIPARFWKDGFNQLVFRYHLPNGQILKPDQQLIFYDSLQLILAQ